jgi:hypothetical protein
MEINTITINKTKNHLSPQLTACKNTTIYDVDSQGQNAIILNIILYMIYLIFMTQKLSNV